jgi:hypothetical protein
MDLSRGLVWLSSPHALSASTLTIASTPSLNVRTAECLVNVAPVIWLEMSTLATSARPPCVTNRTMCARAAIA